MKYYAVTDDPTELLHYGVKGMKWGEHLFGDDLKPKSPAYKNAVTKLKGFVSKAAKAVKAPVAKKTEVQKSTEKRAKQQAKFNNAVKAAQNRIKVVENLSRVDSERNFDRKLNREYKKERRIERDNEKQARVDEKRERRYAKNERKMEKYLQQARQGKLKYGKLSDDQVHEITDRLGIERNARILGSAEKTWRQQKKDAFRQGKLQGITRGTAAAMEELARAGTVYGIQNWRNRRKLNAAAKQEGKEQHIKDRAKNKKTAKEIRDDIKQEAYESEVYSGKGFWDRSFGTHMTLKNAARILEENKNTEHEKQRRQRIEDRIKDDTQLLSNEEYQRLLDSAREKKRKQDVQDKLANERDENWQRYLDENGLTDEQARSKRFLDSSKTSTINVDGEEITVFDKKKSKGTSGDPRAVEALNNGNIESAGSVEQQRQKILNENDRKEYKQYLDNERLKEEKEQQEIIEKRTERENKRIEEAEKWNKEEENRFSKEYAQYENDLAEFNKYERLRESSPEIAIIMYPSGGPKKPKEPERPKYKNTTFNDDVTKLPTVYNPSGVMTFSEWRREKYSKNQNGKKKNQNNNKNNGGGGNR